MTQIKLYNTKARAKQDFTPIDPKNVRMYVCGPTVYDRAHLGNARPVVVFDVLYRLLRHVYGPDHVTYVRNFTDVDDKINATALARKEAGAPGTLEQLVHERSNETIDWYLHDMGALGALEPNEMPRATEFIGPMIAMIEDLIAKGHAYEAEGHVLFAVESYKDYGALSGRSVDDMIAGARVEVAPYKRNPMDFVLWKPSDDELPGWDSPWGRGRPGWHIECSAMSHDLLGASFDIHGGGNDLQFPHHENEIAQSRCAHPESDFANYWLHNEMLQVEGKKMSKSLGNFFTVHDLLEQGVPGEVIRFVFLGTHYRKPMDWTEKKAKQAASKLAYWRRNTARAKIGRIDKKVVDALTNDLNTPYALTLLENLAKEENWDDLKATARLLGLLERRMGEWDWKKTSPSVSKARQTRELKSLRDQNLDFFVARDRFFSVFKAHGLLVEASETALPFVETESYEKLKSLDTRLRRVLREYSEFDFDGAIEEAKEWRRLGKRYPLVFELADNSVEKKLEVYQRAGKAKIASIALKMESARDNGRYWYADQLRDRALKAGFELVVTRDGIRWRLAKQ